MKIREWKFTKYILKQNFAEYILKLNYPSAVQNGIYDGIFIDLPGILACLLFYLMMTAPTFSER